MSCNVWRVGLGDRLIGVASTLLLIDLFARTWFEYKLRFHVAVAIGAQRVGSTGWQAFGVLGPLTVIVCLTGISIFWLTLTRRSPALPVVVTTLLAPVAIVSVVLLAIRVLVDRPGVHLVQGGAYAVQVQTGAYVGLGLSALIALGTYMSLRREGVEPADSPSVTETLAVEPSSNKSPT